MDEILEVWIFFIYLDDILISSGTKEEHMKHLWEVFRRLQQAGLTINLPKSEFFAKELKFLLHTVKGSSRLPSTQLRYGTTPLLRLKKILGLLNFFTLSFLP